MPPNMDDNDVFANLPNVPMNLPGIPDIGSNSGGGPPNTSNRSNPNDEIDFDDLSKRFEELKKKK